MENGSLNGSAATDKQQQLPIQLTERHREAVRVIGQYLRELGLAKSAEALVVEAACPLESGSAAQFRRSVLLGDWDLAEASLASLRRALWRESTWTEIAFRLAEQRYLELLESGAHIAALCVLRSKLTPLQFSPERVHRLSGLIMCSGPEELRQLSGWSGAAAGTRQDLLDSLEQFFPPSVMLPPKRLTALLDQAVRAQVARCRHHNTSLSPDQLTLLADHTCPSAATLPSVCSQVLDSHQDEVHVCQFSPDGSKLATGGRDCVVHLWQVETPPVGPPRVRQQLPALKIAEERSGVAWLAWSPDSRLLLACAAEDATEVIVWDADTGDCIKKLKHRDEDSLTTAAWLPDSNHFVVGGNRGHFYLCSVDFGFEKAWDYIRVVALATRRDEDGGTAVLAADTFSRVRRYRFDSMVDETLFREEGPIMSMSISADESQLAVCVASAGVHLWDLRLRLCHRRLHGFTHGTFLLHACFGGFNQDFVASGSHDGRVCVWHRGARSSQQQQQQHLLPEKLSGHGGVVSCVSWNPRLHGMLASASDDCTVRIWLPSAVAAARDTTAAAAADNGSSGGSFSNGCCSSTVSKRQA